MWFNDEDVKFIKERVQVIYGKQKIFLVDKEDRYYYRDGWLHYVVYFSSLAIIGLLVEYVLPEWIKLQAFNPITVVVVNIMAGIFSLMLTISIKSDTDDERKQD